MRHYWNIHDNLQIFGVALVPLRINACFQAVLLGILQHIYLYCDLLFNFDARIEQEQNIEPKF